MSFALATPPLAPRRPAALRVGSAPAASPAGPVASTPAEDWIQAEALVARACAQRRLDLVAGVACEILRTPSHQPARDSLWAELADLAPAPAAEGARAPSDGLWLMRNLNGAMIGLLRLRQSGLVASDRSPAPAGWCQDADGIRLLNADGTTQAHFPACGRQADRRVWVGIGPTGTQACILSEVNCHYAQLRMLDPELTGPLGGLYRPEQLTRPGLPPVPVVLLAAPRTGSHLLLNLLNSSGEVLIDGEILNPGKISVFGADLPQERKDGLDLLRMSDPVRFAKVMLMRSHHVDGRSLDRIDVRGFKLFPEHSRPVFDWAMEEPGVRVIHLHRANLLAEFSSYLVALKLGHWVGGPASLKNERVVFDRIRFEGFVQMKRQYLAAVRERLARRAGPTDEIEYSAIGRASANHLLSGLLGRAVDLPLSPLGMKPQLNECVIERFANKDAVMTCLDAMGTPDWAGVERRAGIGV